MAIDKDKNLETPPLETPKHKDNPYLSLPVYETPTEFSKNFVDFATYKKLYGTMTEDQFEKIKRMRVPGDYEYAMQEIMSLNLGRPDQLTLVTFILVSAVLPEKDVMTRLLEAYSVLGRGPIEKNEK